MADFTADERDTMASQGISLPDGSYPVPDAVHLDKAIMAVGLGSNNAAPTIRKHIIRRAKALGQSSKIPDSWRSDGTIQKSETEMVVPLIPDASQQIVYGVVLTPDQVDSQGDVVSAQEIEKAAHRWLVEYRKHDVQHDGQPAAVQPVESYIAPSDMEIEGTPVRKGAWILAAHVADAATWQRIEKGELTGWSIGGTAERI